MAFEEFNLRLQKDIRTANKIKDDFEATLKTFKNIDDPDSIEIAKKTVFKYEKFENSCVNIHILHFLYGDMARAYLHAREQDKAESYAVAYYKLNKKSKDTVGENQAVISILDTQLVRQNYKIAYYLCVKYLKRAKAHQSIIETKDWLENKLGSMQIEINLEQFEKEVNEFYKATKMPELFTILNDEDLMSNEQFVRAHKKGIPLGL